MRSERQEHEREIWKSEELSKEVEQRTITFFNNYPSALHRIVTRVSLGYKYSELREYDSEERCPLELVAKHRYFIFSHYPSELPVFTVGI